MKDSLTIEEIVKSEGLCAVGFKCKDCPNRDTCMLDEFPFEEVMFDEQ